MQELVHSKQSFSFLKQVIAIEFRFRFYFHKRIILTIVILVLGAIQLSTEIELEQLLCEKAVLEEELRRLEGHQKELEMRARTLCEKIIQELKNKSSAKREAINQLQSKVDELEAQLEKFSAHGILERASAVTSENAENPEAVEEATDGSEETQEKNENIVMVTAFDKEEV